MHIEQAYAKINLYLKAISRRENGYHNIVSIMQTVSLSDTVKLAFIPSEETEIELRAEGNAAMPTDRRNLAYRAAEKFLECAGLKGRVYITLEKHIPMSAGLAGGSADAAAVLRGLNALCGEPLNINALCAAGATLGADVPFCIVGGSALVTGIGERMQDFPSLPALSLVVACAGEGVSTPWAYGELDRKYGNFEPPLSEELPNILALSIKNGDVDTACEHFYNQFEEVVAAERPYINTIKDIMKKCGADFSMMSGSGPSVFGIFPYEEAAKMAVDTLLARGIFAYSCTPVGKYRIYESKM